MIAKEVGLGLNDTTNASSEIRQSSGNHEIIDISIEDLESNFGVDNITLDNLCLPNIYW